MLFVILYFLWSVKGILYRNASRSYQTKHGLGIKGTVSSTFKTLCHSGSFKQSVATQEKICIDRTKLFVLRKFF